MVYNATGTRHLPPDLQELVDSIISEVVALAFRANSNRCSNSLEGTCYVKTIGKPQIYRLLAMLLDSV